MSIKDEQAFPFEYNYANDSYQAGGVTKLEYFAGLAMQGLLANRGYTSVSFVTVAEDSILAAKDLIAELDKLENIK